MRGFSIAAGAFLVAAALAAATWLWTPDARRFDRAAALAVANEYDARIIRDKFGVPHIYGARNSDVAFGLAFAHAEDDWATFEEVIRFSRGELARVTGEDGAITDYLVAAMDVSDAIDAKYQTDLSADTRAMMEGYAAGLNYYCATNEGACAKDIPPLTGKDIVAGFSARQPFFYGFEEELKKLLSPPAADGDDKSAGADQGARYAAAIDRWFGTDGGGAFGSNAVAISPKRSAEGATRLLVNSHQPYTGPVAWYEARVKSEEGWDAIGGVFPGSPFILHGATPDFGWAFTVNKPDLVDVYALTVNDEKRPTQYRFDGEWRDFEEAEAAFRVKLFGPFSLPVKRRLLRSVHGPVFETPDGWAAVAFAGDRSVLAPEHYARMNLATTYRDWRAAFDLFGIPSLNAVYADRTGRIGYFYNAAIPVRDSAFDWSKPVPGDAANAVWKGVRGFDEVPQVVDPASGYVGNANNSPFEASAPADAPADAAFPPHYGIDRRKTNRGGRLVDLYLGDASITEAEFFAYKMDDRYREGSAADVFASDMADRLQDDPSFTEEVDLLRRWNRRADAANREAALAILSAQASLGYTYSGSDVTIPSPEEALKTVSDKLKAGFGRIDPEWGEVSRLIRGDVSLPLDGGPDTLRAVYALGDPAEGPLTASFGDTYIMAVGWSAEGEQTIKTIHQFGSATLDAASPHYADQAAIFAAKEWRAPAMALDALLAEATRDYRVGARAEDGGR
ncbi:MAG: penicillin acylase family protein [Pseudomonadota bacterium]